MVRDDKNEENAVRGARWQQAVDQSKNKTASPELKTAVKDAQATQRAKQHEHPDG